MFIIETFVGTFFGTWLRGEQKYSSKEAATKAIDQHGVAEHACNATIMQRRAVPA